MHHDRSKFDGSHSFPLYTDVDEKLLFSWQVSIIFCFHTYYQYQRLVVPLLSQLLLTPTDGAHGGRGTSFFVFCLCRGPDACLATLLAVNNAPRSIYVVGIRNDSVE